MIKPPTGGGGKCPYSPLVLTLVNGCKGKGACICCLHLPSKVGQELLKNPSSSNTGCNELHPSSTAEKNKFSIIMVNTSQYRRLRATSMEGPLHVPHIVIVLPGKMKREKLILLAK